jgi:hypothetical protein
MQGWLPSPAGLDKKFNPSRSPETDHSLAQYIERSIANSYARDNAPTSEYPRPGSQACNPSNAAAYADELEMEASQLCPFAGSFAGTTTL